MTVPSFLAQLPLRLKEFLRRHPDGVRGVLLGATFLASFGLGGAWATWSLICRGAACPSVDVIETFTPRQTSKLYAADGRFIAELGVERRTLIRIRDIPPILRQAFLIAEDKRFYAHHGIDWRRVIGAGLYDLRVRRFDQGFSTITMQLARNIFPERISREKSPIRKAKEARVASRIEARYPKDRILELYLNQINLGNGAYGVESAAQRYFGKSARDLNLAEAATLAALPKAPERYNPRRFPERAIQRRNTIIELMRREGVITDIDASLAKAYPLRLAGKAETGEVAPYFVEWIRQQLDEQFGRQLYEQGLKVFTTLDLDMQSAAERALERQLRAIEGGAYGPFAHTTYEQYLARTTAPDEETAPVSPYLQGAFIVLDPRTGAVRALVGGRDFDDSKFNRATQALRQPGSTFKPIVFADAIQSGRPPSYIVNDTAISVPQLDSQFWTPQNYDLKFEGRMTLRRGLYQSRNIVAIKVGMELGEESVVEMARKFGITTPIPPYPSIHIGSADVHPLEMVAAYTTFPTYGVRAAPRAILRVENARGEVLWETPVDTTRVLTRDEDWLMVDMMKDVVRRGSAAGAVTGAGFTLPAGGKTGTTNDGTDVWFIGYTADLVAGLWMGLDKPQKIKANAQGGILAAPAWTAFMREIYQKKPAPPDWPRPEGLISRVVDDSTGMLKNPFCPLPRVYTEYYIPGTEPTRECDVHTPFTMRPGDTTAAPPVKPPAPGPVPPAPPPPPRRR